MAIKDPHASRFLGIAGPSSTEQEKASLKQAVFLLRYRARLALSMDPQDA